MSMRTSRIIVAALLSAGVFLTLPQGVAMAFDPEKVFADEKPSTPKIWRFFFSARKLGQEKEAVSALEYAAEQGDHAAQWKLGRMYETGDGVPKDPAVAVRFFRKIADNFAEVQPGTADWQFTGSAMTSLGKYYRDGVPEAGVAKDPAEAMVMLTTAATYFDHPDAQFELGRMYLDGENTQGDVIQAARMLKSASDSGHAGAQALLGHLLFEGIHIRQDTVRGLSMMMNAQKRASAEDSAWISSMQEEAFALASEEERRRAIIMIEKMAPAATQ